MKRILISEEEKERILGMHKKNFLNEKAPTNVTTTAQTTQKPGAKPTETKIGNYVIRIPQIKNEQQLESFTNSQVAGTDVSTNIAALFGKTAYNFISISPGQFSKLTQDKQIETSRLASSFLDILTKSLTAHAISGNVNPIRNFNQLSTFISNVLKEDSQGIKNLQSLLQYKNLAPSVTESINFYLQKYPEILQQRLQSIGYASSQSTTPQPNKPY